MYTNIDTDHALRVFRKFFKEDPLCAEIRTDADMILEALEILMRHNLFKFGDTYWRQIDGTAMGAPPAPAYATIYYAIHEFKLLRQFQKFLFFYRRYIDDALVIWRSSPCPIENAYYLQEFARVMDDFGMLTWKVEPPSDSVDFMDLTISIEQSRLVTKIFEKKENPYLYLPPSTAHTTGIIKGTIIGMVYRYYALITYQSDFNRQVENFFHRLVNRGYRSGYLRPIFMDAIKRAPLIDAKRKRNEPKPSLDHTCLLHIPFHPSDPPRTHLQNIFKTTMLPQDHTEHIPLPDIINHKGRRLKIDRLIICYHRQRNIKDCLFPRKFAKRPGPPVSSYIDVT